MIHKRVQLVLFLTDFSISQFHENGKGPCRPELARRGEIELARLYLWSRCTRSAIPHC